MSLDEYNKKEEHAIQNAYSFDYEYCIKTFSRDEVIRFCLSQKDSKNFCIESFDADADGEFIAGSDFDTVTNFLTNHKCSKIYIAVRESGDIIDEVDTIEEGIQMIEYYEKKDIEDGTYEENFYALEDEEHNVIYF